MNNTIVRNKASSAVDTKERILDAAERLFAEHGFAGTSLRVITAEAAVNLAAVNYHFHSKDALIEAVFARRAGPLNQKRLALLDACEAAAGDGPLPLEPVIHAIVRPIIELRRDADLGGVDLRRLMGRMYVEPGERVRKILLDQMREVARRFTLALRRALPEVPLVELIWRMHFGVGVMIHTLVGTYHLEVLSGGLCDPSDVDGTIERMVAFLAAGLRAPVPSITPEG
jgi:AcrR family transcriptional regulator